MTKIKIIAVGTLTPKFKAIYESYAKNISNYAELNLVEIKEFSEEKNIEVKKDKETKNIIKQVLPNSLVVLTSLRGKQYSSEEFSEIIRENINKDITFIIGGSDGVIEDDIAANLKICFSKMTFPHQLFRVMLVEQIYRAFMIINNKKYHK
ncbi:23S rRNA (pseudouridine(1915)-N(3))-methyltransferase RlmH [Mycoplasmopsis adleri]|uniref:23S rRNA (pseudouridine(1915)-N(3))-methyltransferase RlmH n=1 Tax=Mycoplasmopsis adleri TaxID=51362 RepID=UPI00387301D8